MVLIDYENAQKAVGFVMEHNMIDNYWDSSTHIYGNLKAGNVGKMLIRHYKMFLAL